MKRVSSFAILLAAVLLMGSGCGSPIGEIQLGVDYLEKGLFVSDPRIQTVNDIQVGELDLRAGPEICFLGFHGALFSSLDGTNLDYVASVRGDHIIDTTGDGVCEILQKGGWAMPTSLYGHDGEILWRTQRGKRDREGDQKSTVVPMERVDEMTFGDLDGDRELEFLISGDEKLILVNRAGATLWSKSIKPFDLRSLLIFDVDGDGSSEIIRGGAPPGLSIYDTQMNLLAVSPRGSIYFGEVCICRFPTRDGPEHLLAKSASDSVLVSLDKEANVQVLKRFRGARVSGQYIATPVQFGGESDPHFAIFGALSYQPSIHALYVYNANQVLVYHEIFDRHVGGLAAVPTGTKGEEVLLVGAKGKIWRYKRKDSIF